MNKNIVIVGANGRLGQALQNIVARDLPGCEVAALTRQEADLEEPGSLSAALDEREFDLLLMAAAMTDVDACEREPGLAHRLNAEAPGEAAQLAATRGVRMVHFSTDYVFDGESDRPYVESDPPNPRSVYGQSKLGGERAVLEADAQHLVVRLSWLFGPGRESATPDWVIRQALNGGNLKLVTDKVGSPSDSLDIAEAVAGLFFHDSAHGVMHLCNEGACSWIEWAQESLVAARDEGLLDEVPPIAGWTLEECFAGKAPRPPYSAMANVRYQELTGKTPRRWQDGLRDYVRDVIAPRVRNGN